MTLEWLRRIRAEREAAKMWDEAIGSSVDQMASHERIMARQRLADRLGYESIRDMINGLGYDPITEDPPKELE